MSMKRRRRTSRILTMSVVGAAAIATFAQPAQASPPTLPNVSTGIGAGDTTTPQSTTVTLITGDAVSVTTIDGKSSVSPLPSSQESQVLQTVTAPDGDVYAYPAGAMRGIVSGLLDRELFNVTALAEYGYDDASTDVLPVIVQYESSARIDSLASTTDALPATHDATPLPAVNASGVDVDKDEAASFFDSLGVEAGKQRRHLAARQISRVLLDGKVHVALEQSVPQIGAPDAWAAGYDGTGVTVGVLDTGVDPSHPDLVGHITSSRSFIEAEPEVTDGHGHGTHVASTIAGSGAASDGRLKGVAPGADLMVGKVLDAGGSGPYTSILDGMTWAAEGGADVVSMSLGGRASSAHDILSDAVDALSDKTGALFVIAAGNDGGYGESTLGSPGTADSALTVGAVDKQDDLAPFSSRGPRVEDLAIKPEITAPGVNIVAGRANGTSMGTVVDEHYTTASGTSMATPHVAAAAAILKQEHPKMTGPQLKDALVSTAQNHPGYSVYEQGAGRVDLTAATTGKVFASAKADFGKIFEPDGGPSVSKTRTVTYTNDGATDVTLDLALNLDRGLPVADGEVSLSDTSVTVPAGGSESVTITVESGVGELGRHNGYLTATADGVDLTTSVGYVRSAPEYELSVKGIGRDGEMPYITNIAIFSSETGNPTYVTGGTDRTLPGGSGDTFTTNLPKGRYIVQAYVATGKGHYAIEAADLYANPDVDVTKDVELVVDARTAQVPSVTVPDEKRDLERSYESTMVANTRADGRLASMGTSGPTGYSTWTAGIVAAPGNAGEGSAELVSQRGYRDPLATAKVIGRDGRRLDIREDVNLPRSDGTRTLEAVSVGAGTDADYTDVDVAGKLAVIVSEDDSQDALVKRAADHGATAVLFTRTTDGYVGAVTNGDSIPAYAATAASGRYLFDEMAKGPVRITLTTREESRFTYQIPASWKGKALPEKPSFKAAKRDFAKIDSRYHSDGVTALGGATNGVAKVGVGGLNTPVELVMLGHQRDEYVYATPELHYQKVVNNNAGMVATMRTYSPGKTYQEEWFKGPLHTGRAFNPCQFCRTPTAVYNGTRIWGDSDPTHFSGGWGFTTIKERFYRDGVQYPHPYTDLYVPESATYRFEVDRTRESGPGTSHSSQVNTAFTYESHAPKGPESPECAKAETTAEACSVPTMIFIGYDAPVSLTNQAPADRQFSFELSTPRPYGYVGDAKIAGATVSVSYDDGETWTEAKVKLGGDGVSKVSYRHPKLAETNGFASLKVEVWDDAGSRTTETITRAYGLV